MFVDFRNPEVAAPVRNLDFLNSEFFAWLREKAKGNERYHYLNPNKCLLANFLKETGRSSGKPQVCPTLGKNWFKPTNTGTWVDDAGREHRYDIPGFDNASASLLGQKYAQVYKRFGF
jgi:hypothetical protein